METQEFLIKNLKEHWADLGRAIDDLKDSYHQCNATTFNTEEWKEAVALLDDDFIAVQNQFEALNVIDALFQSYQHLSNSSSEQISPE